MKQKLREYGLAIYRAFFDASIYRRAVYGWTGFGGGYLFVLASVLSVLITATVLNNTKHFERNELPRMMADMPHIALEKGVMTVISGKDPALLQTSNKKMRIIIDSKSSEEDLLKKKDLRKKKVMAAIGKNFVLFRSSKGYESKDLVYTPRTEINGDSIKKAWPKLYGAIIFMYPVVVLGQTMLLLLFTTVVAVLSYVVTAFIREEYDFEIRMRLCALALTPGLLISQLAALIVRHDMAIWFPFLLSLLYFYAMILLMRRDNQKLTVIGNGNG